MPVSAVRTNWLGGPLRRHCKDLRDVEFQSNSTCNVSVRGSYEITYVAKVSMVCGKPERRFVMFRIKHYDPPQLVERLAVAGLEAWESLTPYASNERNKIMLMLLRKVQICVGARAPLGCGLVPVHAANRT